MTNLLERADDLGPRPQTLAATHGGVPRIPINRARVQDFCERWKITELSFFGSVLTDVGREVDLVVRRAIEASENWIHRRSILEQAEPYMIRG